MHVHYVSKLFFGKYAYKVVLQNVTGGNRWWRNRVPAQFVNVDAWCAQHVPQAHKVQRRYQGGSKKDNHWHQLVYLTTEAHKQAFVQAHIQDVVEVWQPLDSAHLHSLEVRNIVEIRTHLLFKKFRHAVYFKYDRTGQVWEWLETHLADSQTSKLSGSMWWPKVYSEDESDIIMLRLSYPDAIDYVKTVRLVTD